MVIDFFGVCLCLCLCVCVLCGEVGALTVEGLC